VTDSHDDAIKNIDGIRRLSASLADDDPVQQKLMEGTIEMMMALPDATKVMTEAFMSMANDMNELSHHANIMAEALERADAYCSLVVGKLLELVDNNSITEFTPEQLDALNVTRWVVNVILSSHEDHTKLQEMADELIEFYKDAGDLTADELKARRKNG
jgi:hypothetical protein